MKRLICLILVSCFLLSSCSVVGERIKEPVRFYYVRDDYRQSMGEVIVSEIREASGHREDIPYLLALYTMGPSREDMDLPLPPNTRIVPTERTANSIVLSLTNNALPISDADFTLASACIALTCMELTDVDQVKIVCEDRDVTIRQDNLLLYSSTQNQTQEEEK